MNSSLYKVFAGKFYMLDENGVPTDYYKDKSIFRNTYGLVFLIHASTKDRCFAYYFARDDSDWNFRSVFPVGRIIESENEIRIKTRYNYYVWRKSDDITSEKIESLYQWVEENGDTYIPGINRTPGIKEYFQKRSENPEAFPL